MSDPAPVAEATTGAAAGALAFGLVFGGLALHPLWPSIGWLALLALLSQTAGWLFIASSLPRLPAAVSSLMLLLQPAASLALADLILGEQPTLLQVVGAMLTCGGALVASLSATQPAKDPGIVIPGGNAGPPRGQATVPSGQECR